MEGAEANDPVVRFGPFEFHSKGFVLYRKGVATGLEAQPARLLGLLLNRPGQIISRAEIQSVFWPSDGADDASVKDRTNHIVKRLREVLRDCQDDPRYIETIPKRGYRFIGLIQRVTEREPSYAEDPSTNSISPSGRLSGAPVEAPPRVPPHSRRAVIVLCVAAAISLFFVTFHSVARSSTPVITYVSPIRPQPDQTIVIRGRNLGTYAPYAHTDSPWLAIRDNTVHWAAGRIMPRNFDDVMLTVASWKNSEIIVTGFTGMYGDGAWKLNSGDAIEIAVWNPRTGAGPGKFHLRVTELQVSR